MSDKECIAKVNIDLAWESGHWTELYNPNEKAVWQRKAKPIGLELDLAGRKYSILFNKEIRNNDDFSYAPVYEEDCEPTEEDLEAVNAGLCRRADEKGRELKEMAINLYWKHSLLWVQGGTNARDMPVFTCVDYRCVLSPGLPDPYQQLSIDVYNSVSIEDLESNGWLKGP